MVVRAHRLITRWVSTSGSSRNASSNRTPSRAPLAPVIPTISRCMSGLNAVAVRGRLVARVRVVIGLGQAQEAQQSRGELLIDLVHAARQVVEGGDDGIDGAASLGDLSHVAQMDQVERGLPHAQNERAALFEGGVGGALDEGVCRAGGD